MNTRGSPSGGWGGSLFPTVDRAVFASAFADRLRRSGVPVALTAVERCAAALDVVDAPTINDLYWLARVSFVSRHVDLVAFDEVFGAVFDLEVGRLPTARRGQHEAMPAGPDDRLVSVEPPTHRDPSTSGGVPWATLPSVSFRDDQQDAAGERRDDAVIRERQPSAVSAAMDRRFDLLDPAEMELVGRLLEATITSWPRRRSRRRRPSRTGGRVSLRRSLRRSLHTGGDVFRLIHTRPVPHPRRVVALLDVSGSMEAYTRAYLHLVRPLAITHRAEVFAFATELSRITPVVRMRSAADAIERMNEEVGDRFSGTRIDTCLRTLLHHRTWSTCVRGAVVVICSDGWDADDPARLERSMRRLALLAHHVVWVNPRADSDEFEPTTGGMSAALPHCDAFLAGATGRSMHAVISAITAA